MLKSAMELPLTPLLALIFMVFFQEEKTLKFCSQHRDKWNVSVTCLKPCVERHDFFLTVLQSNRTEYDLDYSRHMLGQFKVCQLLICNF